MFVILPSSHFGLISATLLLALDIFDNISRFKGNIYKTQVKI